MAHAILRRMPEVASFRLAPEGMGGRGVTVVKMKVEPESKQ